MLSEMVRTEWRVSFEVGYKRLLVIPPLLSIDPRFHVARTSDYIKSCRTVHPRCVARPLVIAMLRLTTHLIPISLSSLHNAAAEHSRRRHRATLGEVRSARKFARHAIVSSSTRALSRAELLEARSEKSSPCRKSHGPAPRNRWFSRSIDALPTADTSGPSRLALARETPVTRASAFTLRINTHAESRLVPRARVEKERNMPLFIARDSSHVSAALASCGSRRTILLIRDPGRNTRLIVDR